MLRNGEIVLLFQVCSRLFLLPLAAVDEILPAVTLLPVPGAGKGVEGVIEVRGQIVPVLDLGVVLELGSTLLSYGDHLIVLQSDNGKIALRVERAIELASLSELEIGGIGASNLGGTVVLTVAKYNTTLVSILDPQVISNATASWHQQNGAATAKL